MTGFGAGDESFDRYHLQHGQVNRTGVGWDYISAQFFRLTLEALIAVGQIVTPRIATAVFVLAFPPTFQRYRPTNWANRTGIIQSLGPSTQ